MTQECKAIQAVEQRDEQGRSERRLSCGVHGYIGTFPMTAAAAINAAAKAHRAAHPGRRMDEAYYAKKRAAWAARSAA